MFCLEVDKEIRLKSYSEIETQEVYQTVWENFEHLHPWLPWVTENYSIAQHLEFVELCQKQIEGKEALPLAIIINGEYAGGGGFNSINRKDKKAEIGYWLAKKHNGKGIVTKCCQRLLDYAFDDLELNRIVIRCVPENDRSRKIPESLGFTKEGIERQGGLHHGKFVDLIVYSMLSAEWKKS